MTKPNLALIGFSTTGKSTVARLVAAELGWRFADTDQLIVETTGRPIHAIFSQDGEVAFRAHETVVLATVLEGDQTVIATGGGAVTVEANRLRLRERAYLVLLTARPETVVARLRRAARVEPRPLLDAPDPLARIQSLMAQRQAVYQTADFSIATDEKTAEQVAAEVTRWLRSSL